MSTDPVAVAASNNPLLTTLVAAVSGQLNPDVNLVDTLNGDEFTVFAPVDDAFAKIDAATIESLKTDSATLSSILTYHVVPGQLSPDMVDGTQTTVQGGTVEVTGSGDSLMVNGAKRHLRRRPHRQRDRLPHRLGAHADDVTTRRTGRCGGRSVCARPAPLTPDEPRSPLAGYGEGAPSRPARPGDGLPPRDRGFVARPRDAHPRCRDGPTISLREADRPPAAGVEALPVSRTQRRSRRPVAVLVAGGSSVAVARRLL